MLRYMNAAVIKRFLLPFSTPPARVLWTGMFPLSVPAQCVAHHCAVRKNACKYPPYPAEGVLCSYQFRASASPPASAPVQWRRWWWGWGARSPRSWRLGTAGPPSDGPQSAEETVQEQLKEISSRPCSCFFLWPFHYFVSLWSLALHNSVVWSAITWESLLSLSYSPGLLTELQTWVGWVRVKIDQHETEKFSMVILTRLRGQGCRKN